MEVIVGSTALFNQGFGREPKDLDIWTDNPFFETKKGMDVKVIPKHILNNIDVINGYADIDSLYTIKCSHLGWSNPMWQKHKQDVLYLQCIGGNLDRKLYDSLVEFWREELGDKSFLSLDKTKKDFFTDKVNYVYDHDYLHELVAYPYKPMYTKTLKKDSEVLVDKDKFNVLEYNDKVRMFREEIAVIALERWVLNPAWKGKVGWYQAHGLSLQKTITKLTKNWATDFLVLNLKEFIKPDFTYYKHTIKQLGGMRYV